MSRSKTSSDAPRIIVLSGASGVGKTTVAERLLRDPRFERVITATTRAPRDGEADGRDYHFHDAASFEAARDRGEFLEWAEVYGRYYGTPKQSVDAILARGRHAVLVIDVQGAQQLRGIDFDATFVFIDAPDRETLVKRLTGRGTESPEDLARRLETAEREIAAAPSFDHRIPNVTVDGTVDAILAQLGIPRDR